MAVFLWNKALAFVNRNKRDLAALSAVASAAFSALAALNSWYSAHATEVTAKKTAAVQASLAFKDHLPKQPGAAACMKAIADSSNANDVVRNLLTYKEFTLVIPKDDAVLAFLKTCIQRSNVNGASFDEIKIKNESQISVGGALSADIYSRVFNHLNTYESITLYYANDIGDQYIVCQQANPGFQDGVRKFLDILKDQKSRESNIVIKEIPSLMNFHEKMPKDAECSKNKGLIPWL